MKSLIKKKGLTLADMYPAVLSIVLVTIVLGVGLYVLTQVEPNTGDQASAALNTSIAGLATLADWIAVIVVVIAAAIVLGVVINSFGGGKRGGV